MRERIEIPLWIILPETEASSTAVANDICKFGFRHFRCRLNVHKTVFALDMQNSLAVSNPNWWFGILTRWCGAWGHRLCYGYQRIRSCPSETPISTYIYRSISLYQSSVHQYWVQTLKTFYLVHPSSEKSLVFLYCFLPIPYNFLKIVTSICISLSFQARFGLSKAMLRLYLIHLLWNSVSCFPFLTGTQLVLAREFPLIIFPNCCTIPASQFRFYPVFWEFLKIPTHYQTPYLARFKVYSWELFNRTLQTVSNCSDSLFRTDATPLPTHWSTEIANLRTTRHFQKHLDATRRRTIVLNSTKSIKIGTIGLIRIK